MCEVLEYTNPRDAIAKHVDENGVAKRDIIDAFGLPLMAYHAGRRLPRGGD
ncbi:MAG: hypothetical protein H3C26_00010 [Rhodocyclaceae bacterium]|nr:hypothetical protein [Rhodocyclaceae bacterium]